MSQPEPSAAPRPSPTRPQTQQPSGMPIHKYGQYEAGGHPRPHLAGRPDHQGAALAVHRPARRQPGADRPDVAGPQARDVRPAGAHGLQGDRGRLPVLRRDRLRLRTLHHRRGRDPRGRDDLRPDPGPRGADRAHGGVAARRPPRHRAPVQRDRPRLPPGRLPRHPGPGQADRGGRHPAGHGVRGQDPGRRDGLRLPVQPGDLHRHRAGLRAGGLRGGDGRLAARGGPRDHPQPARHGGAFDPVHARGPLRVDVAATCRAASTCACRCTRTTTAVRRWPPPSWRSWPARTASRAACSARASAPATSTWSPWA